MTISHIYGLVKGQPYLTQLIGHSLVRLYNESVFEAKQAREARFTPHDVDQVVNRPAFYEQGSYYFNGIWVQATHSGAAGQIPLMQTLAASDEPLSAEDLFAQTALSPQQAHDSLKTLIQHDVVVLQEAQTYDFAVPLMRRWIREHKPAQKSERESGRAGERESGRAGERESGRVGERAGRREQGQGAG